MTKRAIKLAVVGVIGVTGVPMSAFAQLVIPSSPATLTIDFDSTVPGVSNGSWNGDGLTNSPGEGLLDSDAWVIGGMSEGTTSFGGTHTTGDFARGLSLGGVTSGGLYAFQGGSISGRALGIQPTGDDWTPGTITLRLKNESGITIGGFEIAYLVHVRNDQPRSNSFNFSYSSDNTSYTPIPALNLNSPEVADTSPAFVAYSRSTTLSSLMIAPGGYFFLRWEGNDVSGSGSRDEFALDDIIVSNFQERVQHWDANGTTAGVGGTGNWPDANRWSSSIAGTDAGSYNSDLRAVFAGTPGIVTMTANRTNTVGLRFEVDGYLINSPDGYALTITSGPKFEVTDGAHTATISAPISGTGSFEKAGAGTLVLSGTNNYTGTTTINGGKLVINGSHTGTGGGYIVNTGGTLGGTGTINRAVTVNTGGTLAPGNSIESLDVGSLTLNTGSTFEVEVNVADSASNVAGVDNDVVNVASSGSVALGGTLKVVLLNVASSDGVPGLSGLTYTIINNQSSGTVSGVFNSVVFVNAPGPVVYSWSSIGGDGNDVVLTISQIPEPASLSLLALGALALRRRRV